MTRMTDLGGGRLLLATIVATGMAASPVALNTALAQADAGDGGYAAERTTKSLTPEPMSEANVYEILGTTADEVQREIAATGAYTQNGPIAEYQHEVESGNLEGAAKALAAVSNVPITRNLVEQVNLELGIESRLTYAQIADTAAAMQDLDTQTAVTDADIVIVIPVERADTVYEMLGTTREEAEREMIQARPNTQNGPLEAYQHAVESGNLDRAAEALAAVSNVPITEDLVQSVNLELGIESRLTYRQIADAAAER